MNGDGLRICAPVESIKTSQQVFIGFRNLPAGYYRDLQTSAAGQSMCWNGRFAIETSIKILRNFVLVNSHYIDEENEKERNEFREKVKALEVDAKLFGKNAESWKQENLLFTSTAFQAGATLKAKSNQLRSTQKSFNSLIFFRLICFRCLLETGIAFTGWMTPNTREITVNTNARWHGWQPWKVVR